MKSLIKAVSWRIFGTLTTLLAVFIFTHEWSTSFYVGALEMIGKILLFYCHERLWLKLEKLE
jgi:adenylylsulfate kinase